MAGFKPNDNAKDIKGSLLRLAPLLLRFCSRRWTGLGWSGVEWGCRVPGLAGGVCAGLPGSGG